MRRSYLTRILFESINISNKLGEIVVLNGRSFIDVSKSGRPCGKQISELENSVAAHLGPRNEIENRESRRKTVLTGVNPCQKTPKTCNKIPKNAKKCEKRAQPHHISELEIGD